MTPANIRLIMQRNIDASGSAAEWARTINASPQYICDVLQGRRDPGKKILDALGLERIVTYRKRKQTNGRAK